LFTPPWEDVFLVVVDESLFRGLSFFLSSARPSCLLLVSIAERNSPRQKVDGVERPFITIFLPPFIYARPRPPAGEMMT